MSRDERLCPVVQKPLSHPFGFERRGYAEAMADPEVLWAIANGGATGRIAVAYVEWASAASQDVVVIG